MTEKMDAQGIFDCFQSRREVLSRMGKMWVVASLPVGLAACAEVPESAVVVINGQRYIQVNDGLNRWGNVFFNYSEKNNAITILGREPITLPGDVDVRKGFVSEEEFESLLARARNAGRIEIEGSADDLGSTSSGQSPSGGSGFGGCSGASC